MANEITVQSGLTVRAGYTSETRQDSFRADMAGTGGPSPGTFAVDEDGVDADFSKLVSPGVCRVKNLGDVALVFGPYDMTTGKFYGPFKLLPGEAFLLRLSEYLISDLEIGTGTAAGGDVVSLRFKSVGGDGLVLVEAFDA